MTKRHPPSFLLALSYCLITKNHPLRSFPRNADGVYHLFQVSELLTFPHDSMVCCSVCTEAQGVQAMSLLPVTASQLSGPPDWGCTPMHGIYTGCTYTYPHMVYFQPVSVYWMIIQARHCSRCRDVLAKKTDKDTAPMDIIHTCAHIYTCTCIYTPHRHRCTHTNHSHIYHLPTTTTAPFSVYPFLGIKLLDTLTMV